MAINSYSYNVIWSDEDTEYVGLCTEFPSLSFLANTHKSALSGIQQLVNDVVAEMQASGETVPSTSKRRRIVIVDDDKVCSPFKTKFEAAIAKAISEHHRNGRDTYGMRNGKIVVTKPDGRILDLEDDIKE